MTRKERDAKIKGHMLVALGQSMGYAPLKGVSGAALLSAANDLMLDGQQVETMEEAIRIIRELEAAGYAAVTYCGRRPSEILSLKHVSLVIITDRGLRLWREELPVDASVWQDRID